MASRPAPSNPNTKSRLRPRGGWRPRVFTFIVTDGPRRLVVKELRNLSPPICEENLLVGSREHGRRREFDHPPGSRGLIAVPMSRFAGVVSVTGTFSSRAWRMSSGIYRVMVAQARFAGVVPVVEIVSARVRERRRSRLSSCRRVAISSSWVPRAYWSSRISFRNRSVRRCRRGTSSLLRFSRCRRCSRSSRRFSIRMSLMRNSAARSSSFSRSSAGTK
jgi:hypothetical protein